MASPPEDSSLKFFSPLGESGFLPHRPMSSGIDSITQGFRFAAPGKKLPVMSISGAGEGGEGGAQGMKNDILSRERTDAEINGVEGGDLTFSDINCYFSDDKLNFDDVALKVYVPILPPTPPHHTPAPPSPSIHTSVSIFAIPEDQMMLPPFPFLHPSDRGRNTSTAREKRKRIDIPGSLTLDAGVTNGITRSGSSKVQLEAGTTSDQRRPKKKRQVRPGGPPKSHIVVSPTTTLPDGNSEAEIIVLDDDVKVEPAEVNDSTTALNSKALCDNGIRIRPVQIPGSQRDGTFQVHADQSVKHHTLEWKDSNWRVGGRLGSPNERAGTLNSHSVAGGRRASDQGSGGHKSSVGSNGTLRKKRPENDGHLVGPQSQQSGSRTITMPSVMPALQEQEQSSTGEHRLLVALTTLTTEKQALEKKLNETMFSLKAQVIKTETSERKNREFGAQAKASRDNISGLKKKMMGFQKFVDGLGKDYNMLNEKNSQLNNRLNEVLQDRDELFRNLQDVRFLAEKVEGAVHGWGSSRAMLEGAHREIEKLDETLKFLHSQLSENAGLLAAERDRTQSLEHQIQEDREGNKIIITAIQDGKLELAGKLTELQNTFKTNTIEEKIIELQKAVEIKIEVDGGATRSLVGGCLEVVEKLRDREVDAVECLIGVEKRINHTSDSIVGVFQETHKMNVEALTFTDGYIAHLNSRIKDLEEESKEMREKNEFSLIVSAEKRQLEKDLEQQLRIATEKCNEMNSQVERGKATEIVLNERIYILEQKLLALETRPTENITMVEVIKDLELKNCELKKEYELAMDSVQDANLSLQTKHSELETLRTELETLTTKHQKARERIEGFEKEKAGFMAHAEEQKMKERIIVETNANMFRQRETSKLNNQIKALEAQKERLEADNKGFRNATADGSDLALQLRKEITKLQAKYTVIEKTQVELLQEKSRLESLVKHLTQLEATTRSSYSALEKRMETTGEELSKALKQIDTLHNEKNPMLQNKQKELEHAKLENYRLREDTTALQIVEQQLRKVVEEAGIEKGIMRREKNDALHTYETLNDQTKGLEEELKELRDVNRKLEDRSPNAMAGLNEKFGVLREGNEASMEVAKAISPGKHTIEQPLMGNWGDGNLPFTPPERILETQIEHNTNGMWSNFSRIDNAKFERYLFGEDDMINVEDLAKNVLGETNKAESQAAELLPNASLTASRIKGTNKDSESLQTRKNMATKFTSRRKTPTIALDNTDDAAIMIEDFSEDDVAGTGIPLSRNTCHEQTNPVLLAPKTRVVEDRERKFLKRAGSFESTPTERHSFTPATSSNKIKTPQRNDDHRGLTDDGRKVQHRPRKERGKKNKDDQEWAEEGGGSPKNNRGKEESPNMKKSLRSYKERKRGGKRFV